MFNPNSLDQALDRNAPSPHIGLTCGQSRGGGVRTSKRTRRSRFLGRVAVTHVQGSPKGGGALCVRRVLNTRLAPVPPSCWGASMTTTGSRHIAINTGLCPATSSPFRSSGGAAR